MKRLLVSGLLVLLFASMLFMTPSRASVVWLDKFSRMRSASTSSNEVVIDGKQYYILVGDFHVHTLGGPLQMIQAAQRLGYDFIALTDHNRIDWALEGKEEAEKTNIDVMVIVGEEVTTSWGHILGLKINELVSETLKPDGICEAIHAQGGYAIAAHPDSYYWNLTIFKSLIENHRVDAWEAYNRGVGNCTSSALGATPEAATYPFVGDSDAIIEQHLGTTRTMVFSVNRTVEGIFDAVFNHRVVVRFNNVYVGDKKLVSLASAGSLRVMVKDSGGNVLSGATVTSTKQPTGQSALSGTTSADGTVTFTGLAVGNYTLQVSKNGYVSGSAQGNVLSGAKTETSTTLQAQPASGGIPGFPFESVIIGLLLCTAWYWLSKRDRGLKRLKRGFLFSGKDCARAQL